MKADISEVVKEIKRSFRLHMNGVAAHSMRSKGADYKLNWGLSLADLQEMARRYGKDQGLAAALWKEDIRECKILATLLMPAEQMTHEMATVWMGQVNTQDLAEMAAFNLFQHLDCAPTLAFEWVAADGDLYQICAYQMLSRLFMRGYKPGDKNVEELMRHAGVALNSGNIGVRHAALNCMVRLAALGDDYRNTAEKYLKMSF